MKIAVLTSVHNPFDARVFHKEALTLVAQGWEVALVAQHAPGETVVDGVRIIGLPRVRRWLRPLNWLRIIRYALRERADIYHLHDPELLPVGLLIQWLTRKPVVYDAHEWYSGKMLLRPWIPHSLRPLVSTLMLRFEPFFAQRLAGTITADHLTAAELRARGVQRPETIYNFPLLSFCPPPSVRAVDPHHGPTLLYMGILDPARGLFVMLETVSHLIHELNYPAHLLVIGDAKSPGLREQIQQRITALDIGSFVHLEGYVPHHRLGSYLAQSDIGFLACDPEMFRLNIPTKMFEYMAGGLPVLATRAEMIGYFLDPLDCGILINSQDPRDYAQAIISLCASPQRMIEMGQHGRQAFEAQYNWDSEGHKLVSFYERLVAQR